MIRLPALEIIVGLILWSALLMFGGYWYGHGRGVDSQKLKLAALTLANAQMKQSAETASRALQSTLDAQKALSEKAQIAQAELKAISDKLRKAQRPIAKTTVPEQCLAADKYLNDNIKELRK